MENGIDNKVFLPIIKSKVSFLMENLVKTPGIKKTGYKISSETWMNDNGIALGAVSCLRNPADEAIELTIDLQQKEQNILIGMGIYWSDGRVIQEIAEMEIFEEEFPMATSKLETFLDNHSQKAFVVLSSFLLTQVG